jgi:hypothetical protein
MLQQKFPLSLASSLMVVFLPFCLTSTTLAQYQPPRTPPPQRTIPGGPRSPECIEPNQEIRTIIPLIPDYGSSSTPEERNLSNYGLTISKTPTLLVYLPKTNATIGELVIRTQDNRSVARRQFNLPDQKGIVSLNLADLNINPLEINQFYWWSVSIICDDLNRSANPTSERIWLQVIEPSDSFQEQIANSDLLDLPFLYGEGEGELGGFWYDAIYNLVNLRQLEPDNSDVETQWQNLLKLTGLEVLTEQPLLDCCQFQE